MPKKKFGVKVVECHEKTVRIMADDEADARAMVEAGHGIEDGPAEWSYTMDAYVWVVFEDED